MVRVKLTMIIIMISLYGQSQMDCEAIEHGYSGSCKTLHSDNKTIEIEGSCVNGRIVEMTRYTEKSKVQEHGKFNPDSLVGVKNIYIKKGKLSRKERINGDSLIVDILDKSGNRKIKISTSKKSDYATWEYYSREGKLDSSVIFRQYTDEGYFRHSCPYSQSPALKVEVDSIFNSMYPDYVRDSVALASESVYFELVKQRELPSKLENNEPSLPSMGITIILDAQFPEGKHELRTFLKNHLNYPDRPRLKGNRGRILLTFFVETTGELTFGNLRGTNDPDLNREAIKLFCEMPNWKPATEDGVPFRQGVRIPLTFY